MPSTTFLATDPNGVVHKRTSQNRQYTHTVVARPSKAWAINVVTSKEMHRNHISNFSHYSSYLDGTSRFLERRTWQSERQHQESVARDLERAREALQGDMDVNTYIARKDREALDAIEQNDKVGFYNAYSNLGWCGSLNLAHKLASKQKGYWVDVTILEAVKKV